MSFDWLRRVRQKLAWFARAQSLSRPRQTRREIGLAVAAEVQQLERKRLLSAAPAGPEFRVNTFTTGDQRTSEDAPQAVAMDADGDFVVTWWSQGQDGGLFGVYAQRYNAAGVAQGSEFRVNTFTTGDQRWSTVAMDADGDFVITWSSFGQDGDGYGIYAQRYNSAGVAQGTEFRVNSFTSQHQEHSTVAMDADGDFVVTWSSSNQEGNNNGIYAQRYNAAGVAQGSEFRVNSFTDGSKQFPTVAMDADGDFVVTWSSGDQDGSSDGIYAQRYNAAGVAQGAEFRVNTFTSGSQRFSRVALDADGDFVVAWSSYSFGYQDGNKSGVYAQRYNAMGIAQGSEFRVNTYTTNIQGSSSVTMDADGDFVVTWSSAYQDGSVDGVFAQCYNAAGLPQGSEFAVNTFTTHGQTGATVAMDADGDFVVAWLSHTQDGSGNGVYARRYDDVGPDDADDAGPIVTDVLVAGDPLFPNEQLVVPPSSVTVLYSEDLSTAGATSVTNSANWRLTKNGVDVSSMIGGIAFGLNGATSKYEAVVTFTAALTPGDYVLTAKGTDTITDLFGNALDGNFDGAPGGDFSRAFRVRNPEPIGGEFRVNTYTTDSQTSPEIASDADGNFVVVWTSNGQDEFVDDTSPDYGIFAQLYYADGMPRGAEFQVNTETHLEQWISDVAMNDSGKFVVTWDSPDGWGYGLFGQQFNADGSPLGGEFQVNTYTTRSQRYSSVAMDAGGDFVVTWSSYGQDGDSFNEYNVYAQRFAADGSKLGGEFRVNTHTNDDQWQSVIAMDADGNFVIAWTSGGQEGPGNNVYARRFDRDGNPLSGEFRVNTETTGSPDDSSIAMDANGDFVVAWESFDQDGSSHGVFAQRFDRMGAPVGSEFQVNTFTTGEQGGPSATMDADGDFVISWTSVNQDGDWLGVYAQKYAADGTALGGEFRVNTFTTDAQTGSSVAMDSDGDFVIAWASGEGQDGSNFGVYAQRFGTSGTPPTAFSISPTINEDTPLNGGLLWASDPETPIDDLIYTIISPTMHGTVTKTGVRGFNYVPNANFFGVDTFQFTASDGQFTSVPATVSITVNPVNDMPNASSIAPAINEDTSLNGGLLWAFDVETPIDSLVYTIISPTMHGTLTQTGVRGFNYTPNANFSGMDSFQFTASDGDLTSAPATVSITVNPVNDTPTASSIAPVINEDTPLNGGLLWAFDVETPTDDLTYTITSPTIHGTVTKTGVRGFNYVPNANFFGTDSFQFTASDGSATSAPATVTITVNPVNDAPTASSISPVINEDTPLNGGLLWAFDPETPVDGLSYSITSPTMHGTVTKTGVRGFNYVPNANFFGTDFFQFTASDGEFTSALATVTITVNPVNDAPVASSISPTINEDTPLNGGLLWAFDPETPVDGLSYSITSPTMHGTVTKAGVRGFNYVPNANFFGTDSFQFTASDGELTSAPATVTITVEPVNDVPVAFNLDFSIDEDTSLVGGMLSGFDVETPVDSLIYTITSLTMHGTITQTGVRSFNYTPSRNFHGVDTFEFNVSDGEATSAVATVTITVNPRPFRALQSRRFV